MIPSCVQTCLAPGKFTMFNIIIDLIDIFMRLNICIIPMMFNVNTKLSSILNYRD